jgi:hypothetical protein
MCGEEEEGRDMLMCEETEILDKGFRNIGAEPGARRTVRYKYKEQYKIGICIFKYKDKWKETARKYESEIEI